MNKYKAVPIITCLAVAALALGLFLGISFKSKRNGDIADADRSHAGAAETVEEATAHTDSLNVTGNHITADSEGNEQNTVESLCSVHGYWKGRNQNYTYSGSHIVQEYRCNW